LGTRYYVELILGAASLLLLAVTLVWNDWIELVFKVDPDAGDGSAEKLVCAVLLAVAVASAWLARAEWRRAHAGASFSLR
jgi:hypothetical protein